MKKYNNTLFEVKKEEIYSPSNITNNSDMSDISESDIVDIFSYENIILESVLSSSFSSMYLQKSENIYEFLYESSLDDKGLISSSLFTNVLCFLLYGYDNYNNYIEKLLAISKKDFIKSANLIVDTNNKFIYNLSSSLSGLHSASHSTLLISDNKYIRSNYNDELLRIFKSLFMKYKMSSMLIPSACIVDDAISIINSYIATSKLDKDSIEKSIRDLQNFKDVCPTSLKLLTDFLENPKSTDLRMLSESLQNKSHNIENLINLYLEDILIFEEKEK